MHILPMSEAPKDREIFALYRMRDAHGAPRPGVPDPGNWHPIRWKEYPWKPGYQPRWGMRWNEEFSTSLDDYEGWIDPRELPAHLP